MFSGFRKTAATIRDPLAEVCLNLWYFADAETGLVVRLAARSYAIGGTDEQRMRILEMLSPTDFHLARQGRVPDRFVIQTPQRSKAGVLPATSIPGNEAEVFDEMIASIAKDIPAQPRFIDGEGHLYRLELANGCLFCSTCVLEHSDGRLEAVLRRRAR